MKKFVLIVIAVIMILSASGCSFENNEDDVSRKNDTIESSGEELFTIPSMIINEVDGLPAEEESAILTGATVGYSSQFYVYEVGMTYYRYDHWSENYYECTLSLPDGYTNGAIIWIHSGGGSGEAIITVKAANGDEAAYLNYLFISVGLPENQEPVSVELMNDEEVARLYKWMGTISSDHMDDLITYLSVSVKDLREIYGNMALEYTETGGSPVYSLENLSGILFVYTGSNTPLLDERIADEIILTSEYDGTIGGLSVGMNVEEASDNIVWDDAWFSLNQGAAGLQKNFDDFTLTLTITCEVGTTPTEENSTDEWNEWKETYRVNPTGRIAEMRVKIKNSDTPSLSISSDVLLRTMEKIETDEVFPAKTYKIHVTGLSTPVTLFMQIDNVSAIEAYGHHVKLSEPRDIYGNCDFSLFEADGAVILEGGYYWIDDIYILAPDTYSEIHPGEEASYYLWLDDEGVLKYRYTHNSIATIIQTGALNVATSYDEFLYAIGDAVIVDGKIIFSAPTESYVISDKYDLDEEWEQLWRGQLEGYSSAEEKMAANRKAKEG